MSPESVISTAASTRSWTDPVVQGRADRAIVDGLTVAIGGMSSEQARIAAATISRVVPGSNPSASLWTDDFQYQAGDVAFVGGAAAHSLDWDDFMHPMHGHCSAVLLPALWPLAEWSGASGAQLVEAFLAGYHVNWLVSLALSHAHYNRGWHATSTIGTIGAAGAAGRLLGLSEERMGAALGVAASMASGVRANFGTMTKGLHAGIAARNGIQAALLARSGITAGAEWLLGPQGMLECFGGEHTAEVAAAEVLAGNDSGAHGIETPWGLVQKPYSCCGGLHGAVEAAIAAVTSAKVEAAAIERVEVHVDPVVPSIMRVGIPVDEQSARYSPSWVIAAACVDRAMGPAQVSRAALTRPEIRELRDRVEVLTDLGTTQDKRFAGRVTIHHNGTATTAYVPHAIGHPDNPLPADAALEKALAALQMVMSPAAAEQVHRDLTDLRNTGIRALGAMIRHHLTQRY